MSHNSRKTASAKKTLDENNQVRDLSPSAQSHSSTTAALEWDPSADVGTQVPSNTPVHRGNHLNNEALSGLEQMVLAINYGYDLRSDVTDSRSHRSSSRQDVHKSDGGSDSNNSSYKTATETDPSDQQEVPQTEDNNASTSLSNSEWQTSGLSPSEIELMNKRKDYDSATHSSSVVWVEVVRQDGDSSTRNNLTTTTTTTNTTSISENNVDAEASTKTNSISKKGVGVQVKETKDHKQAKDRHHHKQAKDHRHHHGENKDYSHRVKNDNRMKTAARSTQYSETQLSRHHHQQPQVQECCYCIHGGGGGHVPPPYSSGPIPTNSEYCYHYPIPIQCHCYGMTVQGTGSGVALQSQGTQSSNNGGGGSSKRKGDRESTDVSKSSSTDVTPTCLLIDKLIKEGNVTLKNYGYEALEEHRQSLVRKMRKELHHLEKLNKMLLDRKKQRSTSSSSTTTPSALTSSSLDHSKSDKDKNSSSTPSQFQETVVKHTQIYTTQKSRSDKTKNNIHKDAPPSSEIKQQQPQQKHKKQEKREQQQQTENKKPISYFLPFPSYPNYFVQAYQKYQMSMKGKENNNSNGQTSKHKKKTVYDNGGGGHSYSDDSDNHIIFENDNIQISLQQAFQQYCPNVLASVQQRENVLNNLKQERECRAEIKREYFSSRNNCLSPNDSLNNALPPKEPRLMSIRQMKELTEKKLKNLPEVREKMQKRRVEEDKKTYRVMSQVFSRKLRQNVLKGDVNVVHTRSLIRR